MIIFIDLQTGRIVHAVEGRSEDDIQSFLKQIARKAKHIQAVAMNMSKSYSSAVAKNLPGVDIVFDRYHIMALMNKAIEKLRREQQVSMWFLGYSKKSHSIKYETNQNIMFLTG